MAKELACRSVLTMIKNQSGTVPLSEKDCGVHIKLYNEYLTNNLNSAAIDTSQVSMNLMKGKYKIRKTDSAHTV